MMEMNGLNWTSRESGFPKEDQPSLAKILPVLADLESQPHPHPHHTSQAADIHISSINNAVADLGCYHSATHYTSFVAHAISHTSSTAFISPAAPPATDLVLRAHDQFLLRGNPAEEPPCWIIMRSLPTGATMAADTRRWTTVRYP